MDPLIGQIMPWPMDWAPEGWLICAGQQLPIQQYQALYSLLGIRYGGNGTTNFNLPDLRGRMPVGWTGGSPVGNIPANTMGQALGSQTKTINVNQMPAHNHTATINTTGVTATFSNGTVTNGTCSVTVNLPKNANTTSAGTSQSPTDNSCLGVATDGMGKPAKIYSTNAPDITLGDNSVTATGSVSGSVTGNVSVSMSGATVAVAPNGATQPFDIMPPYLVMNYIIAIQGIYPQRP